MARGLKFLPQGHEDPSSVAIIKPGVSVYICNCQWPQVPGVGTRELEIVSNKTGSKD